MTKAQQLKMAKAFAKKFQAKHENKSNNEFRKYLAK